MIIHEASLLDLHILSLFIGTVNATKIKSVTFHETFTCAEKYFEKCNIFKMFICRHNATSYGQASLLYGVPKATLFKLNKGEGIFKPIGRKSMLSKDQEESLAAYMRSLLMAVCNLH